MRKIGFILLILTALFFVGCTEIGYTLQFDTNGHGQEVTSLENVTTIPSVLPSLTDEGWSFEGWYWDINFNEQVSPNQDLKENTTIYAKWEKNTFSIIYNTNGHGKVVENLKEVNNLGTLPVLEEDGWGFEGWYYDDKTFLKKAFDNQEVTQDIILYAKWTQLQTYTITFITNGHGITPNALTGVRALPKELPILEEKGWSFEGWYYDDEAFLNPAEPQKIVLEDTKLYAKWSWIDPDSTLEGYSSIKGLNLNIKKNLSKNGYAQEGIEDFKQYIGTKSYRKVATPLEFLNALLDARYEYTNTWDEQTKTVTQTLQKEGSVHVIEITEDLNLGYFKLGSLEKATNLVTDYASNMNKLSAYLCMSDMLKENGISQIKIENTSNLLIYSKNGARLTHCGFKLTSDTNVVFRNLAFDELWQWEDAPLATSSKIGDYDWFGWAYFKISFCGFIWIDHCTFGKSYDGQIDYANPVYNANAGTAFRAPYGASGENGLHISWCKFNAGSDDPNGYLYKMMEKIEQEYQEGKQNYLYYNALRTAGISFEDILYGIAIPQKKGFLCGDDAKFSGSYDTQDDYNFNLKLKVSFANCIFKNLEDRLPKLRGGNAYMYNCLVDSMEYYSYRTKLLNANARGAVTKINSGWKCALVSQGIVCGNGGSVQAENTIFRGIDTILKHNDTKNVSPYVDGGFNIVNCSYQKGPNSRIYVGSSSDYGTSFISSNPTLLNPANFSWKTKDELAPFEIQAFLLGDLEEILTNSTYGSGTNSSMKEMLLKVSYK